MSSSSSRAPASHPPSSHAPDFNRIARAYRWLEYCTFGRSIERCRTHFLPHLKDRCNALLLGDGDGRFLSRLLTQNPTLHADAVDTSATMLHLLRSRAAAVRASNRVNTYHLSALDFKPTRLYDLIVTHFFLDCLDQADLAALCTRLLPHLSPHGLWLVSDFRTPEGLLRWPSRLLVRSLYLGFRLITGLRTGRLPNHEAAFTSAGLTRIACHRSLAGVLTTELWQHREYTSTMLPEQIPKTHVADPVPDPEPASPSLPGPDPGVFHHQPGEAPNPPHSVPEAEE